jgi:hypothetical protein
VVVVPWGVTAWISYHDFQIIAENVVVMEELG